MDDTTNPYATPYSSVGRDPQPRQGLTGGSGRFDLGLCLSEGWNNTIQNIGPVIGVMVLSYLMMVVSTVTIIGIFLLIPVIVWGGTKFLLNTHDGRCDFEDLFSGFRCYGKALAQTLLLGILVTLIGLVGMLVQIVGDFAESDVLIIIGSFVNLVWTFVVMSRLYPSLLFLVDQELDAVSSLQASWKATSNQWLMVIVLMFVAALVSFAGVLACFVGMLVSIPVAYFMYVSAYRQTVGHPPTPAVEQFD